MTATSSTYKADDGAAYERFIGRWTRRLADAVLEATAPLPSGALLDVGCGTGSLAAAMRARFPDRAVTGVDVAEPYLAYAAARPDCAGCRFENRDACALDLPDDAFAASLAAIVLNFVADPAAAVAEMRRVTRPRGVVAAAGWDFRGGLVYQRLLWDTAAVIDPGAFERRAKLFSAPLAKPDGMLDLWHRAGLAEVTRRSVTIRMAFADFADYWEPLLGGQGPVGGYVAALPPETAGRVRDAVRAAYLAGDADGPRSLTATAWVVRGVVPAA
jgi:ubiquinone/menaquinone biosynthesis C-methylase UbiE